MGAIDGRHIKIQKPPGCRGNDYMNRKAYHSILLQGICDNEGRLSGVCIEPPGRVHDAQMLRQTDFLSEWERKMRLYYLLGDSAYISAQFSFIITLQRDNGTLTELDVKRNTRISRRLVIKENVHGRMKC